MTCFLNTRWYQIFKHTIQVPASLLFHFLVVPQLRQLWDPIIQKRELLMSIDESNVIQRVVCTFNLSFKVT